MNREDGRKQTPEAQKERRRIAIRMRQQGYKFKDIAEAVGVSMRRVQEWWSRYQSDGLEAAVTGRRRGRREGEDRHLSGEEELRLQRLIEHKAPEALGVGGTLWTRQAVKSLIEHQVGVKMPIRTVGEYLRRWGFTPQKPAKRCYAQQPEQVARWLKEDYPELVKRAKREQGEIHWGDEAGVYSETHRGRSYAPQGQTPVVKVQSYPSKVNLISTITRQGKLRFMVYEGNFNEPVLLEFLKRLIRDVEKKVFLIIDGHPVHRGGKVRAWLDSHKQEIEVVYLPPYSPERNPDEYLNGDLKRTLQDYKTPHNREELKKRVRYILSRFQKTPERISAYFKHPMIAYAK